MPQPLLRFWSGNSSDLGESEVVLVKNELKWIWLAEKVGVASSEFILLMEKFDSIDEIYRADYDKYCDVGVSERLCEDLCDKNTSKAERIVSFCESLGAGILTYDSFDYPASLRSLKNPPAVLYYLGKLPNFNKNLCISIVGTRTMSEYGMRAAYKIAYEVASSGAVVVSGMALGIDGIASCAAIAAGGRTVAVLGCGIDIVYPKEHSKLRDIIRQNGAILTEYPPSTEPRGMNFPKRNRIISGISQGTVVVDADISSGAMITAKSAILQGRDIYAVPGNIDSDNCSGTNSLIRDGAQAVLCGSDIVKNYLYVYRNTLNATKLASSVKHSEFDPETVANMGVGMRIGEAAVKNDAHNSATSGQRKSNSINNAANAAYKTPVAKNADASHSENQEKSSNAMQLKEIKKQKAAENKSDLSFEDLTRPMANGKNESGDNSRAVLEKLSEKQRRVFDEMPLDRAVTVDYLAKSGIPFGEVISALTVLEIKGLVTSLPGALYIRK